MAGELSGWESCGVEKREVVWIVGWVLSEEGERREWKDGGRIDAFLSWTACLVRALELLVKLFATSCLMDLLESSGEKDDGDKRRDLQDTNYYFNTCAINAEVA